MNLTALMHRACFVLAALQILLAPVPAQAPSAPLTDAFIPPWTPPPPAPGAPVAETPPPPPAQPPEPPPDPLPPNPTLLQVQDVRAFGTRLAPQPEATLAQTELNALATLTQQYRDAGGCTQYASRLLIEEHLTAYPSSPVKGDLLVEKSRLYRLHGQVMKSREAIEQAWAATCDRTDPEGMELAEVALSELLPMLARTGAKEPLRALLASCANRPVGGLAAEHRWRAKEALAFFDSRAEQNVFCGFSAANTICVPLGHRPIFPDVHDPEEEARFIAEGLSLFELRAHSLEAGGNLTLYKCTSGAAIPVPGVIHWSYGHYSAVTASESGRYRRSIVERLSLPAGSFRAQGNGSSVGQSKQTA